MDGLERFHPNIVAIEQLLPVMMKVRQQYLLSRIKEEIARQDQYEIGKLLRDVMAISECIGVLELLQKSTRSVYVSIVDA